MLGRYTCQYCGHCGYLLWFAEIKGFMHQYQGCTNCGEFIEEWEDVNGNIHTEE